MVERIRLLASVFTASAAALFLVGRPVCAQATGGGGGLANLGGTGGAAGGAGGSAAAGSGVGSQNLFSSSGFGSLGPSTGMGPSVTIGAQSVAARAGAGTTTPTIPSPSNPLGPYYYSPLQYGIITAGTSLPNAASLASTFGQPVYGTAATTTTNTAGTAAVGTAGQGGSFTTLGRSRAPNYYTALSEDMILPARPPDRLQSDLQRLIQRVSIFKGQNIRVQVVDGSRVILQGEVATPRDRERAEAQVRITPGVDDVVNRLVITGTARGQLPPIQRASN